MKLFGIGIHSIIYTLFSFKTHPVTDRRITSGALSDFFLTLFVLIVKKEGFAEELNKNRHKM